MPQRWAGAWPAKASAYGGPTGRTVCPETGEAESHVLDLAFSRGVVSPEAARRSVTETSNIRDSGHRALRELPCYE
ncbi:hypothetical protein PIN31115_02948 [Pandoraea iniqua]|uniref:Uncharacterized protein n=1 Tax=Pandoraea iniqua TaxID=2508288 RepID=A0A5E4VZ54_9BURK|nr:hypothetical protein PIN31115_02948 [Pandoraea iniqua]